MGCVSSKLLVREIRHDVLLENGEKSSSSSSSERDHVVSLTSSTIGVLKLDKENNQQKQQQEEKDEEQEEQQSMKKKSPPREEAEVINAWELMKGLEEEEEKEEAPVKKSPRSRVFRLGFGDLDAKTPLKLLSQVGFSPRKLRRSGGNKENKGRINGVQRENFSPNGVLKPRNSTESPWRLRVMKKQSPNDPKGESLRVDSGVFSTRRRSLSPFFDPEKMASFEKKSSEESQKQGNLRKTEYFLDMFDEKCPPGGENSVVIYTTTLRGIRKTFEDCNKARSIIQTHQVQISERDVSMHSGFKEELRRLMGTKNVKVPSVFVKGRLIGGAEEILKLEEEGNLGILFTGIPKAVATCEGCGGIRFIMCTDCNGSSKVLGEDGRKSVKCVECNENGLIQCPICCC